MTQKTPLDKITLCIFSIRGQRVILDRDLAGLYGVSVKRLNEQVKRNKKRFPGDFVYQLTRQEVTNLRSRIATLDKSGRGKHSKYLPNAFTEHGAIMAATVLNSSQAIQMSVFVVRAFIRMRLLLSDHSHLANQLKELEYKLTQRLDIHEAAIVEVLQRMIRLLEPPPETPAKEKIPIGFN